MARVTSFPGVVALVVVLGLVTAWRRRRRHYRVRGADAVAAQAVFSSFVTDFLTERPGWTVETRGGTMMVYREDRRVPPARLEAFLKEAAEVRQALRSWS